MDGIKQDKYVVGRIECLGDAFVTRAVQIGDRERSRARHFSPHGAGLTDGAVARIHFTAPLTRLNRRLALEEISDFSVLVDATSSSCGTAHPIDSAQLFWVFLKGFAKLTPPGDAV